MPSIAIQHPEQWHALRKKNVGGSEVAALFEASPYTTKFELWHTKAGNLVPLDIQNERVEIGTEVEPAIAKIGARRMGWKIRKVNRYITHPTIEGMGVSLDYEVNNHPMGPGCLECKNVALDQWYSKWDTESEEAPLFIELQLQSQMACTGWKWGAISVMIGGSEVRVIERLRNERVIRHIEQRTHDFWLSIMEGREPEPFNEKDYEAVCRLYGRAVPGKVAHLDVEAAMLCDIITAQAEVRKAAEKEEKAAKAKLINLIGDAETAVFEGYKVTAKTIDRAAYTAEASSYRKLNIKKEDN